MGKLPLNKMEATKKIWGNAMWKFLHVCASFLEDKEAFCDQLYLLTRILPCPECRRHAAEHLRDYPPDVFILNAADAGAYLYVFHNIANMKCEPPKPMFKVSSYVEIYGEINTDKVPKAFLKLDDVTQDKGANKHATAATEGVNKYAPTPKEGADKHASDVTRNQPLNAGSTSTAHEVTPSRQPMMHAYRPQGARFFSGSYPNKQLTTTSSTSMTNSTELNKAHTQRRNRGPNTHRMPHTSHLRG